MTTTITAEVHWEEGDGSGHIVVGGQNMPEDLAIAMAIHALAMETGVDTDTATQQVDGRSIILEPDYATLPFDLNYA
jgi:hypothetical protein